MLKRLRRRIYRKIRFKTWYRKANYYHRKRGKEDAIIASFKSPKEFADKSYLRALKRDMVKCLFKYGSYYNEYFLFGFEGRDDAYRASFITEGIRMSFYPRMNSPKNTDMLENKYRTYKKFEPMYKREMICIRKRDETTDKALETLAAFAARHECFVVKPVYAAFGKGVHLDSLENYASLEEAYESFHKNGAVLEEWIEQGEAMKRIHPNSVNTLRIPTIIVKNSSGELEVRLFHPTIRVGQGESFVDNFSAGGISALIDPASGEICSDGADKKGHRFEKHPDTGVRFKGYKLPEWGEALKIVKTAALMVPGNNYCGWDLAYGKDGWCMVEANCTAQMGGMQIVTREGRRAELEELIAQMPERT